MQNYNILQCLKYGGITTHLRSDKQEAGSDKYIMVGHKNIRGHVVVIVSTDYLLTSECRVRIFGLQRDHDQS